ncbi:hypothetical protein [Vogesella urethralis]|uniref:hypothetical protein n=1 Tax=Vogesella urethralis TaxID=2592656 RepID=UPI001185BAD0|nr:hypothetical protein [Vogesella urethralis]
MEIKIAAHTDGFRKTLGELELALAETTEQTRQLALDLINHNPALLGFKGHTTTHGANLTVHLEPPDELLELLAAVRAGDLSHLIERPHKTPIQQMQDRMAALQQQIAVLQATTAAKEAALTNTVNQLGERITLHENLIKQTAELQGMLIDRVIGPAAN